MNYIEDDNKIEQLLESFDEKNFYMIEEEIDIKIQNKYFKQSRQLEDTVNKTEVFEKLPQLLDDTISVEVKKNILIQLASLRDVEAFRHLESHCQHFNNSELNTWSLLAFNEARMSLKGALKDEQQIFISTGLGGKEGKFRYFVVFFPDSGIEAFSDFHKKFITKELDFTLKQNNGLLEETIEDTANYISYKMLIPMKANIQKLFKKIIDNSNQLGPFVSERFIVTNVNEMNKDEIKQFLEESEDGMTTEILDDMVSLN